MFSKHKLLIVVLSLALPMVQGMTVLAQPVRAQCYSTSPTRVPAWTVSGAWFHHQLLLVDSQTNEVLRYAPDGRALGPLRLATPAAVDPYLPSAIAVQGQDLVLQMAGGRFVTLDQRAVLLRRLALYSESAGDAGVIDGISQWSIANNRLLVCGDVRRPETDTWDSGVFSVPLSDPSSHETLLRFGDFGPTEQFSRLGFPFLTAIGGDGYFLEMGRSATPRLHRFAADGEHSVVDLKGFSGGEGLPSFRTFGDYDAVLDAVEERSIPVGLYGWDGALYVFERPVGPDGIWTLARIEPRTGEVVDKIGVDVQGAHVMAIPGDDRWAFVSKGEVRSFGDQDVLGILTVPSSQIRSMKGTLLCQ